MGFRHEKLGVYPTVIEHIAWAFRLCGGMKSHRNVKGFDSGTDFDRDSEGNPLIYAKLHQVCRKSLHTNPKT